MKPWIKKLLLALLALMVLLAVTAAIAWWWLSGTRSGAEWALGQAQSRVERLEWNALSGTLSDGLVVENVLFRQAGLQAEVDRLEMAVGIRPGRPLRVTVQRLHADGVDVALPEAPAQQDAEPFALGDYSLPIALRLQDVRVRDVVIQPPPAESQQEPTAPIEIQRLVLAGLVHQDLRLDQLELDTAPFQLEAQGRQGLSAPWTSDLDAALDWQVDADTLQQLSLTTEGDLRALTMHLRASGPARVEATMDVRNVDALEALAVDLELAGELNNWPGLELALQQIELSAAGDWQDWRLTLNSEAIWAEYPPATLDFQAVGTDETIEIERGLIRLLDGRISTVGQARWTNPIQASARIELAELDFTTLYPDWPQQARLSGTMNARLDRHQIELDSLALRAPPSALNVTGQAQMNLQTHELSTALEWLALTWPPVLDGNETEPLFSSESGTFEASGTLDEWRAELEAIMTLPGVLDDPEATLDLSASGNAEQISQFNARLESEQAGALNMTGRAGFDGRLNASLNLQQFNPAALAEQLPGQINGQLRLGIENLQPLSATLDIDQLDGRLRNLPLAGSGGISVQQQMLSQADLKLALGDNALDIQSRNGQTWQLEVQAPNLNQLWPELTGELFVNGSATPEQGTAEWQFNSDQITWREYRAQALDLQVQIEGLPRPSDGANDLSQIRPALELTLTASDVDLNPWERLSTFKLSLSGDCSQHSLSTELAGSRAEFAVTAEGTLPDCLQNMARWQGNLKQFDLTETAWGNWQLVNAMPIDFVENRLNIGAACLEAEQSNGALCLNEMRAGRSGTASVSLQALPVDLILLPANPPFRVGSRLDGDLQLRWAANGLQSMDGEIIAGPGALRTVLGDGDLLAIEQIGLVLDSSSDAAGPRGTQARLNAQLEGDTTITAQAEIPDLTDLNSMRLDADLKLDLPDLSAFNRLIPQLDEMGGRLQGELSVRGPIADPELNGQLSLREGHLLHAPLGSRIEHIRLDLTANQTRADLTGQFTAGEGQASVQGEFNAGPNGGVGWQGQLALNGQDVQLFKVDWLSMTLSPDLNIAVSDDELNLDGTLTIDRARLGLPPGAEEQIQPSPDIVVVNGVALEQESEPTDPVLRAITGQIQLVLGEDVRLEAAGMETELVGELDIQWQPDTALPTARGTIELVDGAYSAYGQNLQVELGQVQFTGQPIDNPRLDIEAVREIFGDTQVEKAGVRIRGSARNPDITLFTSPPSSREKALAYVLTGADFDHAGGQGAFNVGFWVLPNVFVSYGLGLFDSGNVLAARWELSRRWGLRATSGERDTGADISFMIDR